MRRACLLTGIAPIVLAVGTASPQALETPSKLVHEVVYNEMQDHNTHGLWRYWVEQHSQNGTQTELQVETTAGPVSKLVKTNGRPLDPQDSREEENRLRSLIDSPGQQLLRRREYEEDEKRVTVVLGMLADAYLLEDAGEEDGCRHLRFRPDPSYVPRSMDARVMRSLQGDLWIDLRAKRLARIEAHFSQNVDFAFGLLGHIDKGGWFNMQRVQVSPSEWKTERLEIHLSGRAMLFKSLSRETSEVRGGFAPVPSGIGLDQGVQLLEKSETAAVPTGISRIRGESMIAR